MLFTKTRVDAAEEDRSPGMSLTSHGNCLARAGIPIGHLRSHENGCGSLDLFQGVHKELFWNAVSAIRSWNMLEGRRSVGFFSEEFARSISAASRQRAVFQCRMMDSQTVDQVDIESASPEIACQIKKTDWLGPEIVSGEVVDPGIDEDQRRSDVSRCHHGFHPARSIERRAQSGILRVRQKPKRPISFSTFFPALNALSSTLQAPCG
jgi:hypothetical protein